MRTDERPQGAEIWVQASKERRGGRGLVRRVLAKDRRKRGSGGFENKKGCALGARGGCALIRSDHLSYNGGGSKGGRKWGEKPKLELLVGQRSRSPGGGREGN